jgi:hypothetical protein
MMTPEELQKKIDIIKVSEAPVEVKEKAIQELLGTNNDVIAKAKSVIEESQPDISDIQV